MPKVNLTEIIAVTYECESCGYEFDTTAPIYDTLNGKQVIEFACDVCGHDYQIELELLGDDI